MIAVCVYESEHENDYFFKVFSSARKANEWIEAHGDKYYDVSIVEESENENA